MANVSTFESIAEDNVTSSDLLPDSLKKSDNLNVTQILQCLIASIGIVANFTVIIAFLNNKKLRRKVPNIFIINQVSAATMAFLHSFRFTICGFLKSSLTPLGNGQ